MGCGAQTQVASPVQAAHLPTEISYRHYFPLEKGAHYASLPSFGLMLILP